MFSKSVIAISVFELIITTIMTMKMSMVTVTTMVTRGELRDDDLYYECLFYFLMFILIVLNTQRIVTVTMTLGTECRVG